MKHQHRTPTQHRPRIITGVIPKDSDNPFSKPKPLLKASSSIPADKYDEITCFIRGYN